MGRGRPHPYRGWWGGLPWKGRRACGEGEAQALAENRGEALVGGFSVSHGKTRDGRDLVLEVGGLE